MFGMEMRKAVLIVGRKPEMQSFLGEKLKKWFGGTIRNEPWSLGLGPTFCIL